MKTKTLLFWCAWLAVLGLLILTGAPLCDGATLATMNSDNTKQYRLRVSYAGASGTSLWIMLPEWGSQVVQIPNGTVDQAYFQWGNIHTDEYTLGAVLNGPIELNDSSVLSARVQNETGDNVIEVHTGTPLASSGGSSAWTLTGDDLEIFNLGFYTVLTFGITSFIFFVIRRMASQNHNP